MSNDLKLCYFYKKDYKLLRSLFPDLAVQYINITDEYYYQTFLSEPDINYLKLSFPEIELVHEGGKYDIT